MKQMSLTDNLTKEQALALVDAVTEREDLALSASAYEKEDNIWIFEAISDKEPDIEQFNELAKKILGGEVNFRIEKIDANEDYVAKSLANLKPVNAGGFYIYGEHNKEELPKNLISIKIEAGAAFGTGHHETTTACLEAINLVLEQMLVQNILDVGTGSGILAIAVAKSTNGFVLAIDNDETAIEVAKNNIAINGVSENILCEKAHGIDNKIVKENAPYDLIMANILARPIIEMAKNMRHIIAPDAYIILSGILNKQANDVTTAYQEQGFKLFRTMKGDEWTTLILLA